MTFSPEAYLWFKTLHIVGVVVWFAGLFYLVRLFIYHVETAELAEELQQPFRDQYGLMERRLANIITTPGMVVAVSMAIGLLVAQPSWLQQGWMHAKLAFVAALLAYHVLCYRLMGQLQAGVCQWSGRQLRGRVPAGAISHIQLPVQGQTLGTQRRYTPQSGTAGVHRRPRG